MPRRPDPVPKTRHYQVLSPHTGRVLSDVHTASTRRDEIISTVARTYGYKPEDLRIREVPKA